LNASDIFTFGATSDAERDIATKGTQGYNTSYTIPFGYWTLTLAASDYHYHQRIVGANQTFVSSGKSQSNEGKLAYLFYRDQKQKYSVQFRTGQRWSHSYIDDTEVEVQYRNTVFAELALIHKNYIGQAQLDVSVAYRWGAPWYGAQHDAANLTADSPLLNYQLEVFDASLSTPFKILDKPFTYMGTLRAQNSHSPLYATEWFSIGNRWSVRGFDGENTLGAEKGYFLRNEIGMPLSNTQQSIYAGIDYGRVYGPNVINLSGDQLAGAVLGMRGSLVKNMAYDVFASSPLYKPVGFRTEDPALGFSLNYQF
jgi:hemolysin activation/secretion protein